MHISEGLKEILAHIAVCFRQDFKIGENFRVEYKPYCFSLLFWFFELQGNLTSSIVCFAKGESAEQKEVSDKIAADCQRCTGFEKLNKYLFLSLNIEVLALDCS